MVPEKDWFMKCASGCLDQPSADFYDKGGPCVSLQPVMVVGFIMDLACPSPITSYVSGLT